MLDDNVMLLHLCRSLRGGLGHEVRMSGFSVQLAIDLDQGCSVCPCLPELLLRQSACSVGTVCAIVWPLQERVRLRLSALAVSELDLGCSICPCLQMLALRQLAYNVRTDHAIVERMKMASSALRFVAVAAAAR